MPRGQEPKKDAERGETWWGSCMQAMSPPSPNGATPRPGRDETTVSASEAVGGTGGTETSQYPEEAESSGRLRDCPPGFFRSREDAGERPVVVASEPGWRPNR